MNTSSRPSLAFFLISLSLLGMALGCYPFEDTPSGDTKGSTQAASGKGPITRKGELKKGEPGKRAWLEKEGDKRVVRIEAWVCLREGSYGLETLLCKTHSKEHESILVTDADGKMIHALLVAAGAEAGSPVRFGPYKAPKGTPVRIWIEYAGKDGEVIRVPAQHWIMNAKTKKDMSEDHWVFAGSTLWPNPEGDDKPRVYAANGDGAYICVINVPTAILDVTSNTPTAPEARVYAPNTERIPKEETKVNVILEPVLTEKKTTDKDEKKSEK
jgi:hypothetical protein